MTAAATPGTAARMRGDPPLPVRATMGRVALAAVNLSAEGDGVAYAARLIRSALVELGAGVVPVELARRSRSGMSRAEQLRFLGRLTSAEAGGADWAFFTHLGLARAQRWVPRPWRRPHAVFLHGIEVWNADLEPDRRRALRTAKLRIANSEYTARRVAAVHPDAGPIFACPLALHPADSVSRTADASHPLLAMLGDRSVVIIGRMDASERYKGHDELIDCWPDVLAAVPDARLVIAGTGNDRGRLIRKAEDARLGDRVIFPGFVENDLRDALMARASVFAMPSRGEGFGIVYLQAMRAGKPCIGSTADAAGDVIVDGETGWLVDPADRRALASAVVSLLEDEAARRRMGEAGRRRFEREFTFDRFRDRLGMLLSGTFATSGKAG